MQQQGTDVPPKGQMITLFIIMHKYLYNNMDDIEENVEEGNAEQEEDLGSKSK